MLVMASSPLNPPAATRLPRTQLVLILTGPMLFWSPSVLVLTWPKLLSSPSVVHAPERSITCHTLYGKPWLLHGNPQQSSTVPQKCECPRYLAAAARHVVPVLDAGLVR